MVAQYIQLGRRGWNILVYYDVSEEDFFEVRESLIELDCPEEYMTRGFKVLRHKNTGFTYTNDDYKMSVVCISRASSRSQFMSTAVHEAKHVQSHICSYYGVGEKTEEAAYLIGYIVRRMYKMMKMYV